MRFISGQVMFFKFGDYIIGLFIFSDVFFHFRSHGPFGYLQFGQFGIKPFLQTFPIIPLFIGIFLIIFGSILLIKYTKAYRYSTQFIIGCLILAFIAVGFICDHFGLNEYMAQNNTINRMYTPFVGESWIVGEVVSADNSNHQMLIKTPYGDDVLILWDDQTILPFGANFNITDRVRIVGINHNGVITAQGIGVGGMGWRKTFPTLEPFRNPFIVPPLNPEND